MICRALAGAVSCGGALSAAARRCKPCALNLDGAKGPRLLVACDPVRVVEGGDLDALAAVWAEEAAAWQLPEVAGVPIAAGFLSYDLGAGFDRVRGRHLPESPWPLLEFRFYEAFLLVDARAGRGEVWARDDAAARRATAWWELAPAGNAQSLHPGFGPLEENEPSRLHLDAVGRALEYLRAGDIYQVNLARRLGCAFTTTAGLAPGAGLFARLDRDTPACHGFWFADGDRGTALVGNSPERFLARWPDGTVETRPIKGTRPRGLPDQTGQADRNLQALLASAKDRAEHVMIVDLERNDLGRVCQTGSVEVAELCRVLVLPTVLHLESTVRGRLRSGVGLVELLRATFPGGSITGAPKIRAMEIIEELEPARRGPYTGATGWLGAAGDLDLAVAIRTALIRDGCLTLWVGGGVVADSTPAGELDETWDKARAFSRALG